MDQHKRLTITELSVAGKGRTTASVRFAPGLNLVIGASDTGKTFIFEAIDFMLGAKEGLRKIPESKGYENVYLSVDPSSGPPFTLRRAFDGGDFEIEEYPKGRQKAAQEPRRLSRTHSSNPDSSLSAYLLNAIGLDGREVRKNKDGEKTALSFRDVCHLALVDEERIIQQKSPIISGQYTQKTRERNIFAFFMTGQDDSQIIPAAEPPPNDDERRRAEAELLKSLLESKSAELATIAPNPAELSQQAARLDQAIADLSRAVVTTKEQIGDLERRRSSFIDDRTRVESRTIFVTEQLKRLRLLKDYYDSDHRRIEAVVEANRAYHEMPEGNCPLCNRPYPDHTGENSPHAAFDEACRQELAKIVELSTELQEAVADFVEEEATLRQRTAQLESELSRIGGQLQDVLAPGVKLSQEQLQSVIEQRTEVARADAIRATIQELEQRLQTALAPIAPAGPRATFEERATTSITYDFCKVVEEILRAWKYPELGTVSFDSTKADIVIGGQDRANKGKGYRAITYAALAIGLMKYCRQKNIPHPGFVVLDTPLNPFKGPETTQSSERITDEVKLAFYEFLASDNSGDQFIIMENEDAPQAVRDRSTYHHFTKNRELGRYGFFPLP